MFLLWFAIYVRYCGEMVFANDVVWLKMHYVKMHVFST